MQTSFRDPAGRVIQFDGRVIRLVSEDFADDFQAFLRSETFRTGLHREQLAMTTLLEPAEARQIPTVAAANGTADSAREINTALVVEHQRVFFPSFPYEWPPEMLHAAAALTLDLAESCLSEGFELKDATPYNVLFDGHRPVMVDLLSFQRRDLRNPVWLAHAQFIRTFVLPLLANKYFGLPLADVFVSRRDGLEPQELHRMCGPWRQFLPPFLSLATIPTVLSARAAEERIFRRQRSQDPEKCEFVLRHLLKSLRRGLARAAPEKERRSRWSEYFNERSEQDSYLASKRAFVESVASQCSPARALAVGCNTGYFASLWAKSGASVVAIDSDEVVVGRLWRTARAENLQILPLIVDFTRPSPAIGWRNQECHSFLERARGQFDFVSMLGVLHHILVNERVPLQEIIGLAAELTNQFLLIEFVPPADPMFRRIARGRDALFTGLTREVFEAVATERFRIVRRELLAGSIRWAYLLQKRTAA